ncbi:hypothetical protein HHI36_008232 [Cryptolaemus montrouzieri]|uniref:Uncharacterized protein n=1 Tax=Cryptolaemus montrouzieri TaxID=559131 RepID=A0ABD2MSG0_9CUCU
MVENFEYGDKIPIKKSAEFTEEICHSKYMPHDWSRVAITPLYENGDRSKYCYYRLYLAAFMKNRLEIQPEKSIKMASVKTGQRLINYSLQSKIWWNVMNTVCR